MIRIAIVAMLAGAGIATAAMAGPIEGACLRSERAAGNRALCGCIQSAADRTLRWSDQRKAAKFFADPDRAQEVRMSKSDGNNAFWARYKAFGETAQAVCAG